jgi:hypothetical protein
MAVTMAIPVESVPHEKQICNIQPLANKAGYYCDISALSFFECSLVALKKYLPQ